MPHKSQSPRSLPRQSDAEMLDALQRASFNYFLKEVNSENGLIADTNQPGAFASTAVVGLGISVYIAAVKRDILSRAEAAARVLTILRFLHSSPQGPEPDASGYKGFYYHFLDMKTGRRAGACELSTIDTAMLMAGILSASAWFTRDTTREREIRELAEALYARVDWRWAQDGGATISHGWKPESGFLTNRWDSGYSEALILYLLAAGAPVHPIAPDGYRRWVSSFEVKKVYDLRYIHAGPLFIHQLSQVWLDLRGVRDQMNVRLGFDYFENSRRATYIHRQYGIENPEHFKHYGEFVWGLTASGGPGPATINIDGVRREFYGYLARGAPLGPDDGTVSPWAVVASIPFAPEIVIDTVRHAIEHLELNGHSEYGFDASFNPTFPEKGKNRHGWISPWILGLNQGPVILMIENFQSGFLWETMRACPWIVQGLRRLGFRGGWLDERGG
ncbi:MAG TPA: glucoamylase family protein [Bryobacteraceae bacterium]|nr:glucoamylase family protein [Bryobacteraceae bacterium]